MPRPRTDMRCLMRKDANGETLYDVIHTDEQGRREVLARCVPQSEAVPIARQARDLDANWKG